MSIADYEKKVILWAALLLLIASVGFYFLILFIDLKPDQGDILASGQTYMRDIGMLLIGFYWGGSKGSRDKDNLSREVINETKPDPK